MERPEPNPAETSEALKCPGCGAEILRTDLKCSNCLLTKEVFNGHFGIGSMLIIVAVLLGLFGGSFFWSKGREWVAWAVLGAALALAAYGWWLMARWRIYRW